ncbi:MAG TPA: sigma-70 family RNA polymerase sigma factor, partial [Thermoanaerobaculia bacterium]|nr:sigma-70 family RNA polymerase sigma factor [Thermoanaerobaculia bacterium]
ALRSYPSFIHVPGRALPGNLALIDRTIARVCRHARLFGADAEDFASAARLHLMDDDYAVLRSFEGRCSLVTFLTIVLQRLVAQERMRTWGRFYESTAARALGDVGVRAEQLIRRDGRTIDEALPILRDLDPSLTRERLVAIVDQLRDRRPRMQLVAADDVEAELPASTSSDARVVERDVRTISSRVTDVLRDALRKLPLEDRTIVRLHFHAGMALSEIARSMNLAQRPLYRRLERILRDLRDSLVAAGLDRRSVDDIVGSKLVEFDFGLRSMENAGEPSSMQTGVDRA